MTNPTITYNDYRDLAVSSNKRTQERNTDRSDRLFVYTLVNTMLEPLYIGCCADVEKRLRGHRQRDWFSDVHMILVEDHQADDAKAIEIDLIKSLKPKHNVMHVKSYAQMIRDAHTPQVVYNWSWSNTLSAVKQASKTNSVKVKTTATMKQKKAS